LRRLQRHLEQLERFASDLRLMGDPDRQAGRVGQELARAEQRLLVLLAGDPNLERVSPP
jgi:hypothetical protein